MSIISIANSSSLTRGLDYYKSKTVKKLKKISDNEYKSIVEGKETYNVYLNVEHPKQSNCTCPESSIDKKICKHIIATYLKAFPKEVDKINQK